MINRRGFLAAATVASLSPLATYKALAAAERLAFGEPQSFSFEQLQEEARRMATRPHEPPPAIPADALSRLDREALRQIRFRPELALFADGPGQYPVTFLHPGDSVPASARMFAVETDRPIAREIMYDKEYFSMPSDSPAHQLHPGPGFAGFRFQESRLGDKHDPDWRTSHWASFAGTALFKAVGELGQYGLSARSIAVDTAIPGRQEELPAFTRFYFVTPTPGSTTVTVYALLDSASLCGAYRFTLERGAGVVMDVQAHLFMRRDVERLGLAPLASMYWFSEKDKPADIDWRPEVHDSDGLALWNQAGERIWRPLNNPSNTVVSTFLDENPRGFGLSQRDRSFDHYLDDGHYERRPTAWVEPLGDWGKGAVHLVETPTQDGLHHNVFAMWVPEAPATQGTEHVFRYRLHWQSSEPGTAELARCVATRTGPGGQPGQPVAGVRRFIVEFTGEPLAGLPYGVRPEPILWASRGSLSNIAVQAVPDDVPGHWRATFDLSAEGSEPVEMRLFLRDKDKPLTEIWSYQHHPA